MSRIAGVLLAAGASTRFGRPKQLLEWNQRPMVSYIVNVALAAGLEPLVAVLGCAAEEIYAVLADHPIQTVMNWRWQNGLSTSVQVGLAMLPANVDAAIFLQCDQPLITPNLLRCLVSRFEETKAPIVHPVYHGQQATPVLFGRSLFPELAAVTGDQGGRAVIDRHAEDVATVELDDPSLVADVDTPEDYERLQARASSAGFGDVDPQPRTQNVDPQTLLAGVRHLIVDMDGVLWRGDQPVPALGEFFAFLRQRGIRFVLATNNASKHPRQYADKLAHFGVRIPEECILTSAEATAAYLASLEPQGTLVYAVGAEGLHDALAERGFVLTEDEARYVIVGWDPGLTWQKLATATLLIRRGAGFIGTNPDVTFPSEEGLVPGNGAQLAALEAATGVAPVVIGKPQPWLYREAMRRMEASPESTGVVGDRLDTDVVGAARLDLLTILVLSGITTNDDLAASPVKPDLVCADIGELVQVWKSSPAQ